MFKKAAAFLLAMTLLVTLLVGCSEEPAPAESTDGATSQSETEGDESTATETSNDEPVEITLAFQGSATFGDDAIGQGLEERFNMDITYIDLSWADYIDRLNVLVGSGDVPDVFMYPTIDDATTKPIYFQWIDQGILRALPEDMSAYPTLDGILADFDTIMEYNGNRYQIPRLSWQPENEHFSRGLLVRSDYMEAVGITEVPTDLDGLYDLLVALRDGDPDGNGQNDTIPLSVLNNYGGFVENLFGAPVGWVEEDGQAIPTTLSQNYLESVKWLAMLYDEGLLDPDFATQGPTDMNNKFISGRLGVIETQFEAQGMMPSIIQPMSGVVENADEVVELIPITAGPMGDAVMTNQYNHWSGTVFSSAMTDVEMDRVMQMFEWVMSGEGLEYLRWGTEGTDYEMNGEEYVSLLPVDETTGLPAPLAAIYPTANLRNFFSWDIDGTWDFPSLSDNIVDLEKQHIEVYQPLAQQGAISTVAFYNHPDINNFSFMDLVTTFYAQAILGQYDDIDAEFAALKETIMTERGGEAAVAAATEYINQ